MPIPIILVPFHTPAEPPLDRIFEAVYIGIQRAEKMNIPPEKRIHIAVDIGGTFTDLVAFDESSGRLSQSKALTTPAEFSRGVWDCLGKAQLQTKDAASLVHGSTVAINIAIEKTGAKTALVVTAGTKDVYKIGRQNRPDAYNFLFHRPQPLVPRSRTIEANERLLVNGEVSVPLTEQEATRIGNAVKESAAQSVAICFLHSYIDPKHEEMLAELKRIFEARQENGKVAFEYETHVYYGHLV